MRHIISKIVVTLSFALCAISCMEYDMALPRTLAEFTDFQVENSDKVTIDRENMLITIDLNESADMADVKVTSFAVNKPTRFKAGSFPESLDLTQPYMVTLAIYYDFEWTIKAYQPIERYVKCSSQVGNASFDLERREIFVYVSNSQRLRNVMINSMKLELLGAEILTTTGLTHDGANTSIGTVPCSFPMELDCTVKRTFLVRTREGKHVEWSMTVIPKEVPAQITSILPWCYSADVSATYDGTSVLPTIQFKSKSASEWADADLNKITVDGVNIKANIDGLVAATEYEVRLLLNGAEVSKQSFVTDTPNQLYNLNFDDWSDDKTPYALDKTGIWDTANPGTATLNITPTVREATDVISGNAVRMQSMFKAKFAAGNIYVGQFGQVDFASLGATLNWGYGFTSMPVGLKGWYKYAPMPIDKTDASHADMMGKMDKCQIQIFLTDWDDRFLINTGKNQFVDLENDPHIIAFGKIESDENMSEYKEFNISLTYRNYRKPKYIVISCCASYLGDYFTGGVGSTLLVDEFELIYK